MKSKNKKEQLKSKIIEQIDVIDQKQVEYLTKRFIFFKRQRNQKRSLFIVDKIKARQRQLLMGVSLKKASERKKTRYGKLFNDTFKMLPAIDLYIIIQNMQNDLNELTSESNSEIVERIKKQNVLDSDGTLVTSFVQNQRQKYYEKAHAMLLSLKQIENLDNFNSKSSVIIRRKICAEIIKFVTLTQATVDLGYFSSELHYTWAEWFKHSDFTYINYKKSVKKLLSLQKRKGIPNSRDMIGLNYTTRVINTRVALQNKKLLMKGR